MPDELNERLLDAARTGDPANVEAFLRLGANINYQDESGMTALMWAANAGRINVMKLLLRCKADPCLRDNENNDAHGWAGQGTTSVEKSAGSPTWLIQELIEHHPAYIRMKELENLGRDQPVYRRDRISSTGAYGLFSEREFLFKIGSPLKQGSEGVLAQHQFGGRLSGVVQCPDCELSSCLIARIDLLDSLLPNNQLGRPDFPVFWCRECGEWGPMFFDLSKQQVVPFGEVRVATEAAEFSALDLEARLVSLVPVPTGKKAGRKSRLGGSPAWIQDEEIPVCPKCTQGMTFVLQLASNSQISFGDMGVLYAFVCPDCKVSATLIQSH